MPAVRNKKTWKLIALGLGMLVLSMLLVACGGTADTNYDLYVPSSLTAVPDATNNNDFKNAVLLPTRTDIVEQSLNVYKTSQSLADLQSSYNNEMTKRGWTNVSTSILKSDELGSNGVVLAFEKALPDASKKRVIGVILLGPDSQATWLTTFRNNGTLPKDQNVVVAIEGGTGQVPTPAPATTPK